MRRSSVSSRQILHPEAGLLDKVFGPALGAASRSTHFVSSTVQSALDAVLHPGRTIEAAGVAMGGVGSLVMELLKAPDPKSPLKGQFGVQKRVAWSEPVSLDAIKSIGKMSDAKVNDVLVAGMAGALAPLPGPERCGRGRHLDAGDGAGRSPAA